MIDKKVIEKVDREFDRLEDKINNLDNEVEDKINKIGSKITEKEIFIRQKIYPLPPYNFTRRVIDALPSSKSPKDKDGNIIINSFIHLLKNITDKDINQYLRIIKIDNLLMHLVEKTDNEIFYRPLITPTMFIDNQILHRNKVIKGITIVDLEFYKDFVVKFEETVNIKFESEKGNYFIFFFMIDVITYDISCNFFTLEYDMGTPQDRELNDYIRTIICNILDMIYAMDDKLHITTIEVTKEQNEKRLSRNQIPLPTKIFIKPKENFKQYVYKFVKDMEEGSIKITHKFLVRGHWRHFRAERYKKETKEKCMWIKPFWKGEGILIAKEYMITK